jgi:hypothetical protein
MATTRTEREARVLSADDLLAGSTLVHEVRVPPAVLRPATTESEPPEPIDDPSGRDRVRLRPLNVGTLTLISRAARDDPDLVPLLMIKEALVEPVLSLDAIRRLHVGLVHFLVAQVNQISGLTADGEVLADVLDADGARVHVLLARHFGWTPEQVSRLTPGQIAVYLTGIEKLLELEGERR